MTSSIDEFLRFEYTNQLGNRCALNAVRIGGDEIPAEGLLMLCIGAANRNLAQFAEPEQLRQSAEITATSLLVLKFTSATDSALPGSKDRSPLVGFCSGFRITG